MLIVPNSISEKIDRLADNPKVMAMVREVLVPIAESRARALKDMNVDAVPHAISREQGFIRGIEDIVRAFEEAASR